MYEWAVAMGRSVFFHLLFFLNEIYTELVANNNNRVWTSIIACASLLYHDLLFKLPDEYSWISSHTFFQSFFITHTFFSRF